MGQNNTQHSLHNPQLVAWLVVSISFILFCVMCAAGTLGTYWFFFESPSVLTARLTVSQGTITLFYPDLTSETVNDPAANPKILVPNTTLKIIDSNSQGYVTFEDNYSKQIIGTIFLVGNGSFRLAEATRPRFEWSRSQYTILLTNVMGHLMVDIPSQFSRPLLMNVQAASGAARLGDKGSYIIDAADQAFRLYAKSGTGLLVAPSFEARQIEAGNEGLLSHDDPQVTVQRYPFENLITDEIRRVDPAATTIDSFGDGDIQIPGLPPPWGCSNPTPDDQNEPEASWSRAQMDQRIVLHMYRGERTNKLLSHAETGCEMYFDRQPYGVDVTKYTSLRIRLRMKIDDQNVTTCGILGSECPVMLLLDYWTAADDPQGKEPARVWRQGFYSRRPMGDTYIEVCDTCKHVHEQINLNTWYVYESSDLLKDFPADQKPVLLKRIRVYSSGHEFDVALSDLELLAGQ